MRRYFATYLLVGMIRGIRQKLCRTSGDVMVDNRRAVDIQALIDRNPFGHLQWLIFFMMFFVIAADGYDTAAIGFIAPSLVQEWGIARSALGPVMSAALAGLGIGALFAGPISDRFGRKMVLVCSVFLFGAFSYASALATSLDALTALRFLTGLGLGAAMPNALTLMSEFAPARSRALSVNAVFSGFSLGLAGGGALAAYLIPHLGWQSVLIAGGIVPCVLAVLLAFLLPESVQFLAVRGNRDETIARILKRLAPSELLAGCTFVGNSQANAKRVGRSGLSLVMSSAYRFRTSMLWLTYFLALLVYYLLANWLPTLFKDVGFTTSSAALMTSLFPLGGMLGNWCTGWLMDRFDGNKTIATAWTIAAVLMLVVGSALGGDVAGTALIAVLTFLSGTVVTAGTSAMSAYAASIYPTEGRATGIAWMLGIGRIGGVAGAFAGAAMLGWGLHIAAVFSVLAIPAFAAAFSLRTIARSGISVPRDNHGASVSAVH